MAKKKFHFHGPVYKIESYGGKDFHSPLAVDIEGHIMVYDIWRWAETQRNFEYMICHYLQGRYGQLLTPSNVYINPKDIEVIEN